MQPSMFNVRVPLAETGGGSDVFLMNTFTDAQLVVGPEVTSLLDRIESVSAAALSPDEQERLKADGVICP